MIQEDKNKISGIPYIIFIPPQENDSNINKDTNKESAKTVLDMLHQCHNVIQNYKSKNNDISLEAYLAADFRSFEITGNGILRQVPYAELNQQSLKLL